MSEEWRSVVGYEGAFEVSDAGNVRTASRVVMRRYRDGRIIPMPVKGKMLLTWPDPQTGQLLVSLSRYPQAAKPAEIHKLVLEAFLGPCPSGEEACYLDGNVRNNAASNLYWGAPGADKRHEIPSAEQFFDDRTVARYQEKLAPPNERGCILWTASLDKRGYGQIRVGERMFKSHQVAWILANGPMPKDLEPDHLCEVRNCCNAEHLEAVTHAENMRRHGDRLIYCRSGRHKWSEQVPLTKTSAPGRRECRECRTERQRRSYARWMERQQVGKS